MSLTSGNASQPRSVGTAGRESPRHAEAMWRPVGASLSGEIPESTQELRGFSRCAGPSDNRTSLNLCRQSSAPMNPIVPVNFRFPKIFRIPGGSAQDRFAAASNFRRSLMKVEAATDAKTRLHHSQRRGRSDKNSENPGEPTARLTLVK